MRKKGLPAGKDSKLIESEVEKSLHINFNDRIIKNCPPKLVNEWKPTPEFEYYSRQQVARENRVGCDYE